VSNGTAQIVIRVVDPQSRRYALSDPAAGILPKMIEAERGGDRRRTPTQGERKAAHGRTDACGPRPYFGTCAHESRGAPRGTGEDQLVILASGEREFDLLLRRQRLQQRTTDRQPLHVHFGADRRGDAEVREILSETVGHVDGGPRERGGRGS